MKKIIEHGFMNYMETSCPYCGCRFSYEPEDLLTRYNNTYINYDISCPDCAKVFTITN